MQQTMIRCPICGQSRPHVHDSLNHREASRLLRMRDSRATIAIGTDGTNMEVLVQMSNGLSFIVSGIPRGQVSHVLGRLVPALVFVDNPGAGEFEVGGRRYSVKMRGNMGLKTKSVGDFIAGAHVVREQAEGQAARPEEPPVPSPIDGKRPKKKQGGSKKGARNKSE